MHFIILEEVDSTNSYVSRHSGELSDGTMVVAMTQTAGRGQRGNSWESAPGENLTATLFHRPTGIEPRRQFAISEAVALAVADYLRDEGIPATVKWPNDIYVGDRKISGILIEHSVTSQAIEHSRIGIGLNVNQEQFESDAPNPVSMMQLTGMRRDISRTAAAVGARLEKKLAMATDPEGREQLHRDLTASLWRGDGKPYRFRRRSDGSVFEGIIVAVDPEGPITIEDTAKGLKETFLFKEVEFIL
ncbi:MAG: biotin--[acetyl-CoA-carboxylase] ligase [Muribaculaceae bacterium]|nr:biotin--[acetyl-CoA-carboxylase] ligase [Muribaculaceae bacterium]